MGRLLGHGFKTAAERLAVAERADLALAPLDRLDPWRLAEHRDVRVVTFGQLREASPGAGIADDPEALDDISALTIAPRGHPLVVVNDHHPRTRQASSLAHELAHVLLDHPARSLDGGRRWEPELEAEADWLGGALLIPEEAARVCAIGGRSDRSVAHQFGVSVALARWRLDATGARRVAANVHAKRRRRAALADTHG